MVTYPFCHAIAVNTCCRLWRKRRLGTPADYDIEQVANNIVDSLLGRLDIRHPLAYAHIVAERSANHLANRGFALVRATPYLCDEARRHHKATTNVESIVEARLRLMRVATRFPALSSGDKALLLNRLDGVTSSSDAHRLERLRRMLNEPSLQAQ